MRSATTELALPARMDTHARTAYRAGIGSRLAAARKAHGMTQDAVAAELGVSRRSIYAWESGVSSPPSDDLGRICSIFGCSVDWIVGDPTSPDDHVYLIDAQAEAALLSAREVDVEFDGRFCRVGLVAHIATVRVPSLRAFALRLDKLARHRLELLAQNPPEDGNEAG